MSDTVLGSKPDSVPALGQLLFSWGDTDVNDLASAIMLESEGL